MSMPMRQLSNARRRNNATVKNDLLAEQIHNRRANDRAIIENPLGK